VKIKIQQNIFINQLGLYTFLFVYFSDKLVTISWKLCGLDDEIN
jgi:hypothetical protein